MTLDAVYKEVMAFVNREFQRELKAQGHAGSGVLLRSIVGRVLPIPEGDQLQGKSLHYAQILNKGVRPERVPFREGSGAKSSQFITGLTNYFLKKGLRPAEAKSAAFATAKKMKEHGMPTPGSFKYSKNGYRTRFIELVSSAIEAKVNERMMTGNKRVIRETFHKTKSETI